MRRGFALTLCAVIIAATAANVSPAFAQEKGEGPASLFLTYKCLAETRAAFRAHMEGAGVDRFEGWKRSGLYRDYLILFSSFAHSGTNMPDMMVRLDFAAYADISKWKAVEHTMPAGLDAQALSLCKPQDSHLADLTWQGQSSASRDPRQAVYVRVPVHFKTLKSKYGEYFAAYVKPQYDGWVEEGVLTSWGAYHNHLRQGDVWDLLVIYEYRGMSGLARRDRVKQIVRDKLRDDPEWLKRHQNKLDIRESDQAIPMDPILPRQ